MLVTIRVDCVHFHYVIFGLLWQKIKTRRRTTRSVSRIAKKMISVNAYKSVGRYRDVDFQVGLVVDEKRVSFKQVPHSFIFSA